MLLNNLGVRGWFVAKRLVPKFVKPYVVRIYYWLLRNRDWTEIEFELLPLLVNRNRDSVDVGANRGTYTAKLSALTRFVYAFEPDEGLAREVESAGYPNVRVFNCALSKGEGTRIPRIPVVGGQPQISLASLREELLSETIIARTVKTSTLNDLSDTDIGFIKIDVEGHEPEVLEGGRLLIEKQRPVVLVEIEEAHRRGSLASVKSYFENLGYCGVFVFRGKTFAIDDLTPEMADSRQLSLPISRKNMRYVNNFLFFPSGESAISCRKEIDAYLGEAR